MKKFFCLIWCLAAVMLFAGEMPVAQEALLFKADFDGSSDATIANGNDKAGVRGKIKYADGLKGKALISGEGNALVLYENKDNIDFDKPGSIVFFFKANSDWHKTPQRGIVMWGLGNQNGYIAIRISNYPKNVCPCRRTFEFLVLNVKGRKDRVCSLQMPALKRICRGFHMIAVAWAGDQLFMSCDGQPYRVFKQPRPLSNADFATCKRFAVGNVTSNYLIDDFRIYGKKLSDDELQKIWDNSREGGK